MVNAYTPRQHTNAMEALMKDIETVKDPTTSLQRIHQVLSSLRTSPGFDSSPQREHMPRLVNALESLADQAETVACEYQEWLRNEDRRVKLEAECYGKKSDQF